MNHKQKIKLAKKMLSNEEKRKKTSIFQSKNWDIRKYSKFDKIQKQRQKSLEKNKLKFIIS
jgi:hypothetical protein